MLNKVCKFGCQTFFCQPVFTLFDLKVIVYTKKLPRLAPFAGDMKFATQISPLLN